MRLDRTLLASMLGALLGSAALSACDSARPVGGSPPTAVCVACHGGVDNDTGAPPRALNGTNTARAVGAHTAHLGTDVQCGDCHKVPATASDPGHRTKPDGTIDTDGRAEITFGPRAKQNGSTPTYDQVNFTCSGVYCHKTFQGGQGPAAPIWDSALNGGECQGCHGAPPTNHAQTLTLATCVTCHPTTVTAAGEIKAGGTHLDGTINAPTGCTDCHGDASRGASDLNKAAPPVDTHGNQASSQVGAHQAHLVAGNLRVPMQCAECHAVPTSAAHSNGVTEVPFATVAGTIARNDGATPAFNPATGTCSGVYCHGATLHGGSNKTPVFNGGGAQVGLGGATAVDRCGVCHGFPPPSDATFTHPQVDTAGAPFTSPAQCNGCHPQTVNADGSIQLANHVNGTVDGGGHPAGFRNPATHGPIALGGLDACRGCHGATFGTDMGGGLSCNACHANPAAFGLTGFGTHANWQTECTFCHGDPNRAEDANFPLVGEAGVNQIRANKAGPPVVTGKHLVGPGAHLAHYSSANEFSAPLVCTNCHGDPLPNSLDHVVGQVVANFGPLAKTDGVVPFPAAFTPTWEGTPTCTNYCHGATLAGGTHTSPNWLEGATGTSCGSCHSIPLPYTAAGGFHVQNTDCGSCHTGYTATSVVKATHIDGSATVVALQCTTCHAIGAPFTATTGATASTDNRVGAHNKHLQQTITSAITCTDCHTFPSQPKHMSGAVDITWSARATAAGATVTPAAGTIPTAGAVTCANYCHGATLTGGSTRTPSWTATLTGCGTCHGTPPGGAHQIGDHPTTQCNVCHFAVMNTSSNTTITNTALHLNGVRNVQLNPGRTGTITSNGNGSYSCNVSGCHGTNTTGGW